LTAIAAMPRTTKYSPMSNGAACTASARNRLVVVPVNAMVIP
jgi:hypothetical protein